MDAGLACVVAVLASVCLAAYVAHWVRRKKYDLGVFRRYGIPGPEPHLLSGNIPELRKDHLKVMGEWIQKYGKVFGFFYGEVPYVVLTDPDMIKECFIKQCNLFRDRPPMPIMVEPFKSSLLCLTGEEWKRVRCVLNGSFTAAKMKLMTKTMDRCARVTLQVLDQVAGSGRCADVTAIAQGFSMDVITKCALAWQAKCQRNPNNPTLLQLQQIFSQVEDSVAALALRFPPLRALIEVCFPLTPFGRLFGQIIDNLRQVVSVRQSGKRSAHVDMLQLMLDAKEKAILATEGDQSAASVLTEKQLLSNCFVSLAAGFETTATTLAFVLYELARHPEEQDKIYEELVALSNPTGTKQGYESDQRDVGDDRELNYEELQSLERLDAFIRECLRFYPPVVLFIARACTRDTTIQGHEIPAGVNIVVPTWHVHHDPELWPEPHRFDPDRFCCSPSSNGGYGNGSTFSIPEKKAPHPASYVPFGIGPRECIGRRFAVLEVKTIACKVVRRYRLALPDCKKHQHPLKLTNRAMMIHPVNNIELMVERRSSAT
ncbi:cytochrome P450 3A24-like isoform X2 [Haemaphysalis longicornis]